MMKITLFITLIIASVIPIPASAIPSRPLIKGPEVRIINNKIIVNTSIDYVKGFKELIESGIEKELVFRIELIKNHRFWPDEFVVGRKIRRYIGYDALRDRYYLSWKRGGDYTRRYFEEFEDMRPLIFSVRGVDLMDTRALEKGTYYVRIIVESKSRQRIRLMGLLMYLMPEVEMSLIKESPPFRIGK